MKIKFSKYQGTGNDFVIIDNRDEQFLAEDQDLIKRLCDRRFGIGADGLMLLENCGETAFKMRYFNSDGREGSMCGNGGRCIAAFAVHNNIIINHQHFTFNAVDGIHEACYTDNAVSLKMQNVSYIEKIEEDYFLNTGSPHFVRFVQDTDKIAVYEEGKKIRWSPKFAPGGTNANFVQIIDSEHIKVRTFERGVEDETLSCGTGVVASCISCHLEHNTTTNLYVEVLGGNLQVNFEKTGENSIQNIWLTGPATFVFSGTIEV